MATSGLVEVATQIFKEGALAAVRLQVYIQASIMDVSQQLADYAASKTTQVLERPTPIEVDSGLLAAFDTVPIDEEEYESNREAHILALTLTSTQTLVSDLFNLPTTMSENGPIAQLPEPITLLPREKPLPKPKPLTKWERYAKAKGISHVKKDKKVWDEEKQEWVNRWGRDGKNREGEDQWLHEVKGGEDPTVDPRANLRADRKARIAKNEKQRLRNLADAQAHISALDKKPSTATTSAEKSTARQIRKAELDRSMLISKTATASMGKFDKKIEGEPKVKGVKRKFESNVGDFSSEKESYQTLLGKLGVAERKKAPKKGGEGADGGVNVRKALRHEGRKAERSNSIKKRKA